MSLTRPDRQALLAKIDEIVATKYYDPSYGGNDWKLIVSSYRDQILDVETTEEFERAVTAMLAQLPSAELGLLSPSTKIQSRSSINASFRAVMTGPDGARWVFQDVLRRRCGRACGSPSWRCTRFDRWHRNTSTGAPGLSHERAGANHDFPRRHPAGRRT